MFEVKKLPHFPNDLPDTAAAGRDGYAYHRQQYERHARVLKQAPATGDRRLALASARPLLFHLKRQFCSLGPGQRGQLRPSLARLHQPDKQNSREAIA